ncbi:MAG: hypothetical protein GDA51_07410 [Ekhidna sp.]|nr:hypothetical protein [Ekhidna sp.]
MNRKFYFLIFVIILGFTSCNPILTRFKFIYNAEGPNKEIVLRMEELLEATFYNTDIVLIEGLGTEENLDSLTLGSVDIALVENYVNFKEGINSVFSVYSEILQIFYKSEEEINSFKDLVYDRDLYIGKEGSPTHNLMLDLFEFYAIDYSRVSITQVLSRGDVVVELTNLLSDERLSQYTGYRLFSFENTQNDNSSVVEALSLTYPKLSPFLIPEGTYMGYVEKPIVTLSVDLIMVVRSSMGEVPVNDFTKTMLRNRQIFTSIDPLLYNGMKENFDQEKLNIPLHEGARIFFDGDEPGFFERYAELGGVVLSLIVAIWSGLASLIKWQAQKKKDRIDVFYEDLIKIKNTISGLKKINDIVENVRYIQASQNKAFELLISEELVANESFRIYMELSKETINELRSRLRTLKNLQAKAAAS